MTPVKPSSENLSEQARDRTRVICVVSEHANHWPTEAPEDITYYYCFRFPIKWYTIFEHDTI